MDIQYPLLAVGSVTLLVMTAALGWSLTRLAQLADGARRKAWRSGLVLIAGFAAGVLLLVVASNTLLVIMLPRDNCLAWMPGGRGCLLRTHSLLQIFAGMLGMALIAGRSEVKIEIRWPDLSQAKPLAAVLGGIVAAIALAGLDCQVFGLFCTQSDGIPGCSVLLLLLFAVAGYVYSAGQPEEE
jgi:hypothetical protein